MLLSSPQFKVFTTLLQVKVWCGSPAIKEFSLLWLGFNEFQQTSNRNEHDRDNLKVCDAKSQTWNMWQEFRPSFRTGCSDGRCRTVDSMTDLATKHDSLVSFTTLRRPLVGHKSTSLAYPAGRLLISATLEILNCSRATCGEENLWTWFVSVTIWRVDSSDKGLTCQKSFFFLFFYMKNK